MSGNSLALFGGSFNPPHIAHLLVALYALETTGVDALWWVPTWRHAFAKNLAPFPDRLAMIRRLLEPYPRMQVSAVEQELAGTSYTIDTVEHLQRTRPGLAITLVCGADILPDLHRWGRIDELRRRVRFLVVGRGDQMPAEPPYPEVELRPLAFPAISSTAIRAALATGEPATAWLPPRVQRYIDEAGLYRPVRDR